MKVLDQVLSDWSFFFFKVHIMSFRAEGCGAGNVITYFCGSRRVYIQADHALSALLSLGFTLSFNQIILALNFVPVNVIKVTFSFSFSLSFSIFFALNFYCADSDRLYTIII